MSGLGSPVILLHGGAGPHHKIQAEEDKIRETRFRGIVGAASCGYRLLATGCDALEAVEAAVAFLEDDPHFNSGRGSYLTTDVEVEMDASIMDGRDLRAGAVCCLKRIANPVKLARLIMEKTDDVLFIGEGAQKIAKEFGMEEVDNSYLVTENAKNRLKKHPSRNPATNMLENDVDNLSLHDKHGTVGAVAIDKAGNVAFATSTGGFTAKKPDRVGDSCIIGSGGYADNCTGAVSTTGHGDGCLKMCTARQVCCYLQNGVPVSEAVRLAMDEMRDRIGALGGCVAVDKLGNPCVYFTTEGMCWASARDHQVSYGMKKGEILTTTIPADEDDPGIETISS